MIPRIETLKETKLVGSWLSMSFAEDKTFELWRSFSPRRKEIPNSVNDDSYSIQIYPHPGFFENFNPTLQYVKWAAIEVSKFENIPEGLEKLNIPGGIYAVFHYKGKPSEAQSTFQFIHGVWLPNSEYTLDDRPHFAKMDDKYRGEDPDSEEEFWVPVKKK